MTDQYRNFAALAEHHQEGVDYTVEWIDNGSGVLVMAPHGGGIEPGTAPIAKHLAGGQYNLYAFKGHISGGGNSILHITSQRFDEPRAIAAAAQAQIALAIHGIKGNESAIMMGGLDTKLKDKIAAALRESGFTLKEPPPGKAGVHPQNIVNRTARNMGVQFEITRALRKTLKDGQSKAARDFKRAVQTTVDRFADELG